MLVHVDFIFVKLKPKMYIYQSSVCQLPGLSDSPLVRNPCLGTLPSTLSLLQAARLVIMKWLTENIGAVGETWRLGNSACADINTGIMWKVTSVCYHHLDTVTASEIISDEGFCRLGSSCPRRIWIRLQT